MWSFRINQCQSVLAGCLDVVIQDQSVPISVGWMPRCGHSGSISANQCWLDTWMWSFRITLIVRALKRGRGSAGRSACSVCERSMVESSLMNVCCLSCNRWQSVSISAQPVPNQCAIGGNQCQSVPNPCPIRVQSVAISVNQCPIRAQSVFNPWRSVLISATNQCPISVQSVAISVNQCPTRAQSVFNRWQSVSISAQSVPNPCSIRGDQC